MRKKIPTTPIMLRIPTSHKELFHKKATKKGISLSAHLRFVLANTLPANKRKG